MGLFFLMCGIVVNWEIEMSDIEDREVFYDVVEEADTRRFIELRGPLMSQFKVSVVLGLSGQVVISKYENYACEIDSRVYSLFLLVAGEHPRYSLRSRDGVNMKNKYDQFRKKPLVVEQPDGADILRVRKKVSLNQSDFGRIWGRVTRSEISNYESDNRKMTARSWAVILLATHQHPYYYLEQAE